MCIYIKVLFLILKLYPKHYNYLHSFVTPLFIIIVSMYFIIFNHHLNLKNYILIIVLSQQPTATFHYYKWCADMCHTNRLQNVTFVLVNIEYLYKLHRVHKTRYEIISIKIKLFYWQAIFISCQITWVSLKLL